MPLALYRCPACGEECLAEDQDEAAAVHHQTACKGTPIWERAWEEEEAAVRPTRVHQGASVPAVIRG